MKTTIPLAPSFAGGAPLSALADGIVGSEILRIAGEVRALIASGRPVCNLTVGDFSPGQFPIPRALLDAAHTALADGHTNYPPSDGMPELRAAVARFYERELGLSYPVESVLVAGGTRPLLYASYRTLLDPGDLAVYPVPSWNNNHYAYLAGARSHAIAVRADRNFFPRAEDIAPVIREARLVTLNSPLNPTGTVIDREPLGAIASLIVEENARRAAQGDRRFVYLVYDQVYWMLTFHGVEHVTPVEVVPEVAPYTLLLDGASKAFCATGLRVGWGVMPPAIRARMADILGHVGAWAPRAEQVAVAALLNAPEQVAAFHERMRDALLARLDALHDGFRAMASDGYPVDAIAPQGAMYLSARFDLRGRIIRGRTIQTNEDIRALLLEEAGLAAVPFQAFGLPEDTGWFRLSVGAVSVEEIRDAFPRLRDILREASTRGR